MLAMDINLKGSEGLKYIVAFAKLEIYSTGKNMPVKVSCEVWSLSEVGIKA
jgi:hypothetical protein